MEYFFRHTREGGYPYGLSFNADSTKQNSGPFSTIKALWTPASAGVTKKSAEVTALLLVLIFTCTLILSVTATAQDSELKLTPISPQITKFGDLSYLWGFKVESEDPKFGGFSGLTGLRSVKQGNVVHHFLGSVTDMGYYASWEISLPATDLPSISLYPLQPIAEEAGTASDKINYDVEAITEFEDWNLYAYEQDHRVVNSDPEATRISRPNNIGAIPPNGGFEAITVLKNNMLLLLAERPDRKINRQLAWLGHKQADGNFRYETRIIDLPIEYYPSDATTLINGDVILLLRKFSMLKGFSTKLIRITHDMIMSGAPITGHEIADFPSSAGFDNLEGIASMANPAGGETLYLISDDNFNPLQKTVFLAFRLQD